MQRLNYSSAIEDLESRILMPPGVPSLSPMQEGIKRLGNLKWDPKKIIIVAGTNGKGSVCASLEALLLSAGQKVGLYTSPHLEETTERIRLNGEMISKELFYEIYCEVQKRTVDLNLSHFEMLTLMAVWAFFCRNQCSLDWAIFEVGLGGTWDATNAIPHHYCVITSLGMDHENLLGHSIQEIASNKFGIIHQKTTVIHTAFPEGIQTLADQTCTQTQSRWRESISFHFQVEETESDPLFILETEWGRTPLSLPGNRGCQNAATALTVFHELGFDPKKYLKSLSQVHWPGRMERVDYPQIPLPIYYSGDHNPQGIESLIELLKYYKKKHLHILVGIGKDKNLNGILEPLFALSETSIYLTETSFRELPLENYGHWLKQAMGAWKNPLEALNQMILRSKPNDRILVTGSLYLVGFLKHEMKSKFIAG